METYTIASFLLTAVITPQVSISVDATYVDHIVTYCKEKENKFAANEDKYEKKVPRLPNEPELFMTPFINEQPTYKSELTQRVFECIADTLLENNAEKIRNSTKYESLVHECKANQKISPDCDHSYPYRIINGTCNNLKHPRWGSTFSCFKRLWPANYEGVSGLRKSVEKKKPLPNAREISRVLIQDIKKPTTEYTTLFAYFGQAVAHDLAQFPFTMVHDRNRLGCCENLGEGDQHPQCIPIHIDPTDVFYSAQNVHCFNVVRVIPCDTCSVDKRIPINYLTAWLDCSLVYGQTDARAQKLRRNDGTGKLKSQERESGELLPPRKSEGSRCGNTAKEEYCFAAGDSRTDQQTPLMIFQTLLLREHNRIATRLKELNSNWDEERLFQESRRILIAEWHVIIYKEYLPVLLGPKLMSKYGLGINNTSSYDPSVDPSTSVEFNGAAFRLHSILPGKVTDMEVVNHLQHLYKNSEPIYNDRMSEYLEQMANRAGEKYDWFIPLDLTIWLYRELHVGTWGFDLPAVNIQRGRDVGLPSYVQIIEYMENRPENIHTFLDLAKYIAPECLVIFEKIYENVRDIDLFAGIICEILPNDLVISETAAHIIAEQFQRSKVADRFHVLHDTTLTDEQRVTIIEGASLAKLICDNTDIMIIQPNAMLFPSDSNEPQLCSEIYGVNLEKWSESERE